MPYKIKKIIKRFFIISCIAGAFLLMKNASTVYARTYEPYSIMQETKETYMFCNASNVNYGYNAEHKIKQVDYIVVHSTDNPNADGQAHIHWLNTNKNANAVHYYIDANGVTQALSEDIQAWGVGDAVRQTSIKNSNSIQIEICEYSDETLQNQAIQNAILFIKQDLKMRYPNAKIVKHQDASDKLCPRILLRHKNDWLNFLAAIEGVAL